LIVTASYPKELKLYVVAVSIFLMTLGREICKDIRDRAGDPVSFMHRFRPKPLGKVAFSLQVLGLLLLALIGTKAAHVIDLVAMTLLLAVAAIYWFKSENYKVS